MEGTNVTEEPGDRPKEELNCCNKQNDLVAHVDSCEMDIDKIKDEVEYTFDII